MAKGIASGFPFAAIGASAGADGALADRSHGGTYGGNPIGCAAAMATIDVLTAPGFLDQVKARGEQLRAGLRALAAQHPVIADVRGPGLMVAAEFRDPDTGRARCGSYRRGHRALPRARQSVADERRDVGQRHPVHAAARGHRVRDGRSHRRRRRAVAATLRPARTGNRAAERATLSARRHGSAALERRFRLVVGPEGTQPGPGRPVAPQRPVARPLQLRGRVAGLLELAPAAAGSFENGTPMST